jgi:hypothetical protein
MLDRSSITLALLPLVLLAAHAGVQVGSQNPPSCCAMGSAPRGADQDDTPLTNEQIHALVARALESQRSDDASLTQYERIERVFTRGSGKEVADKEIISRVIPTGSDVVRVELARNGKPADESTLEQEWRGVERVLAVESRPDDPIAKQDYERAQRKKHERAEMVDAFAKAFLFRWVGRGKMQGTTVVQVTFNPDPAYKPSPRLAALYSHAHGNIWLEESTAHVVRLDAELSSDVSFGAGVLAKVYQGGRFTFEQTEVAPGVWLPAHATYDFAGRKFLFGMAIHEQVDDSDYRRVGPPEETLLLVRREHPAVPGPSH